MRQATIDRLRELNREFYRVVAPEFAQSRRKLQPGIVRAMGHWPGPARVLDLGCGDGRVGRALLDIEPSLEYLGVDASPALLAQAPPEPALRLEVHDLLGSAWPSDWKQFPFDAVCCFSVLHHLPGVEHRRRFLREMRSCLREDGMWVISVWQVLHRQRFLRRVVDWSAVGLRSEEVDPGDVLLDWQRGERSLRYVHHFEEDELLSLCREADLCVQETWRSDGDSHDLGLYLRGR